MCELQAHHCMNDTQNSETVSCAVWVWYRWR